jgi:hypothetical protein
MTRVLEAFRHKFYLHTIENDFSAESARLVVYKVCTYVYMCICTYVYTCVSDWLRSPQSLFAGQLAAKYFSGRFNGSPKPNRSHCKNGNLFQLWRRSLFRLILLLRTLFASTASRFPDCFVSAKAQSTFFARWDRFVFADDIFVLFLFIYENCDFQSAARPDVSSRLWRRRVVRSSSMYVCTAYMAFFGLGFQAFMLFHIAV